MLVPDTKYQAIFPSRPKLSGDSWPLKRRIRQGPWFLGHAIHDRNLNGPPELSRSSCRFFCSVGFRYSSRFASSCSHSLVLVSKEIDISHETSHPYLPFDSSEHYLFLLLGCAYTLLAIFDPSSYCYCWTTVLALRRQVKGPGPDKSDPS